MRLWPFFLPLFTQRRRRIILRTSALRRSEKFAEKLARTRGRAGGYPPALRSPRRSAGYLLLAVAHYRVGGASLVDVETGAAVELIASLTSAVHVIAAPAAQQPVGAFVAHYHVGSYAAVDLVVAGAALYPVVAFVAFYGVISGSTIYCVVSYVARQEVVAFQAADQVISTAAVQALVGGGADHEVAMQGAPATSRAAIESGQRRAAGCNQRKRYSRQ